MTHVFTFFIALCLCRAKFVTSSHYVEKIEVTVLPITMKRICSQPTRMTHFQLSSQSSATHNRSSDSSHCPRCDTSNNKKRRIKCSVCTSQWHLTCVKLTRVQAETLGSWWCPNCASDTSHQSQSSPQTSPGRSCVDYWFHSCFWQIVFRVHECRLPLHFCTTWLAWSVKVMRRSMCSPMLLRTTIRERLFRKSLYQHLARAVT